MKYRVAAYARVSTNSEEQRESYEAQIEHYTEMIRVRKDWDLVKIYTDEGLSGTSTDKRQGFRDMMRDAENGEIDLILTKSISRFARNTIDTISAVRTLKSCGTEVLFEKENLYTGEMTSEFLLSLMSCFAEFESRSISGNMRWSVKRRFENGTYLSPVSYGYTRKGSEYVPLNYESEVVRDIFTKALAGIGSPTIARRLNENGIPSPSGGIWTDTTVRHILRNPVYVGDMLFQKTYTDENYRQQLNRGERDMYYVRDHHTGIISRETFQRAGEMLERNARVYSGGVRSAGNREKNVLNGKIYCSACGSGMYRQRGSRKPCYICSRRSREASDCPSGGIALEDSLKNAFTTCINKLAWSQTLPAEQRVLDTYLRELREAEAPDPDKIKQAGELRRFLSDRPISGFPEEEFPRLVDRIDVGQCAVIRFACGLTLEEALCSDKEET